MENTITLQGNWFLPNKPKEIFSGILTLTDDRIRLEINGDLSAEPFGVQIPEIYGIIAGNANIQGSARRFIRKLVILQDCLETYKNDPHYNYSLHDPIVTSVFLASTLYSINNNENARDLSLRFHFIEIGFSHLSDFSLTAGRLIKYHLAYDDNDKFKEISAIYKIRDLPRATIGTDIIKFTQSLQASGDYIRQLVINPIIRLKITSQEALTFQEWQSKYIVPLKHFLTLATKKVNYVTNINGFHYDNVQELRDRTTIVLPYDILDRELLKSQNMTFEESHCPLFKLGDIQNDFENVLNKWFELYKKHDIVQNLLFSYLHSGETKYLEDRFLNLARALEVYYKSHPDFWGALMPKKQFSRIRDKMAQQATEVLDEDDIRWFSEERTEGKDIKDKVKQWLCRQLSNDKKLKDKILEILDSLGDLEIEEKCKDVIADKISKYRNHFTHYSNSRAFKNNNFNEPQEFVFVMEYLLQALLLKDISLPLTYIKENEHYINRMKDIYDRYNALNQN